MANTYSEPGYTYGDLGSQYNLLGASPAAAWPTGPLSVRVDLQLGGAWTNVTGDVYAAEKIVINRGRPDEASSAQASSCTFTLNNRTGKYTPKNPAGPYYGQIGRNTRVRIGVGVPPAGTATGGQGPSTSCALGNVTAESSGTVLYMMAFQSNLTTLAIPGNAAAQQAGASIAGLTSITGYAGVSGAASIGIGTGTSTVSALSASCNVFIPGASAPTGPAQQANGQYNYFQSAFGPNATTSAVTVAAGDVLVALVAWGNDPRNAMVTAPIDSSQSAEWTLVSDSGGPTAGPRCQAWVRYCPVADTFTVQAPGECYGGNDTQLTVYQLKNAASWNPRYTGACSDFSSTADLSGKDVRTTITAGQVLRQRGQGQQPNRSCLYRYFTERAPLAYWPLETGTLGSVYSSPIAGVQPGIPFAVTAGADSSSFNPASDSLVQTAVNGSMAFKVPSYAAATNNSGMSFFVANAAGTPTTGATLWNAQFKNDGTSATVSALLLVVAGATTLNLVMVDGTGASTILVGGIFIPTRAGATSGGSLVGNPMGFFIDWTPAAAAPTTSFAFNVGLITTNGITIVSSAADPVKTVGQVLSIGLGVDPALSTAIGAQVTYGHLMFDPFAYNGDTLGAQSRIFPSIVCRNVVTAFTGEPVSLRLRRICQEESIFLSTPLLSSESSDTNNVRHGPQPISNGLGLITLTQTTDGGELAEARGFNGLLYRPLGALGSRPVVQVLDYAAKMIADPLAPADDDQLIRNDITVSQQNGGSARAFLASGTLSTQPPPNGVDTYTGSYTVDVDQQGRDLQQIANWQLAIGTYDAERFKAVRSLLEVVPASATGLSLIDIGNHIQVVNTPNWIQTGPTDLIVIGYQEVLGTVAEWEITFNGRPFGPFRILRADGGDQFARLDSASSTLTSGVASGVTSLSVTTANSGDLWSTTAAPFDILIGGERCTVSAVTGSSSPQTFTVVRSVNGVTKNQLAGAAVHVYWATYLGLNGGS